jgi:hypothetical protein
MQILPKKTSFLVIFQPKNLVNQLKYKGKFYIIHCWPNLCSLPIVVRN